MSFYMEHPTDLDHHKALLREAEQCRLARKALEGRQKDPLAWMKGMKSLRSRLSTWEDHLLEQNGTMAATATFVTTHHK